jgi:hypothetical protein
MMYGMYVGRFKMVCWYSIQLIDHCLFSAMARGKRLGRLVSKFKVRGA